MSQDRTLQESQYRLSVSFIGFYESYLSAYRHRTILAYRSDSTNQAKFQESLDDLFDIAHQDAMSIIRIEEDRLFLLAQREKGRRGRMGGVDKVLALKEERAMKRKIAAEKYALKVNLTAAVGWSLKVKI